MAIVQCGSCGKRRRHAAKGLCRTCYAKVGADRGSAAHAALFSRCMRRGSANPAATSYIEVIAE